MKGRKTKIIEQRICLTENLKERFPKQAHLINEFMREKKLHAESDAWLGLTETGLARMFENFLALPQLDAGGIGKEEIPDAANLISISNEISFIARKLTEGSKPAELQPRLKNEIINELEKLNLKWLSHGMRSIDRY